MSIETGFKIIGSAGQTVDGREIQKEWLTDAVETYDPSIYEAVINFNHYPKTWFGSFGKVLKLKLGKNAAGDTSLLANLEPNEKLISISKQEYIYTSMEIDTNFRNSGKSYLVGLAITYDPASVGTEQLKFSTDKLVENGIYKLSDNKNIDEIVVTNFEKINISDLNDPSDEHAIIRYLKKLINRDDKKIETEEQNMSAINQETAEALISSLSSFSEKLNSFSKNEQQPNNDDKTKVISELEPLLKKYGLSISEAPKEEDKITELSNKIDDLAKKFNGETPPKDDANPKNDNADIESIKSELAKLSSTLKEALGEQDATPPSDQISGANSDLV